MEINIDVHKARLENADKKQGPFFSIVGEFVGNRYKCRPINGYSYSEGFPRHNTFYTNTFDYLEIWFKEFPNCCNHHKSMAEKEWFKKEDFSELPKQIISRFSFVEHFLDNRSNNSDWMEDFLFYNEYITRSFGNQGIGVHQYQKILKERLNYQREDESFMTSAQRDILIEKIELFNNPKPATDRQDRDPNILFHTFQKWLGIFPDLPFFSELKIRFRDKAPLNLFLFDEEVNPYSGVKSFKMRSKDEFLDLLNQVTKDVLSSIDSQKLLRNGLIDDVLEHRLSIISEEHKLKQTKLLKDLEGKEEGYVEIIEKWLLNEKSYFEEIEPILAAIKDKKKIEAYVEKNKTIICFSSNPIVSAGEKLLRLEDEMRAIEDVIEASTERDRFKLELEPSAKLLDMSKTLQSKKAEIVHFMGHGSGEDGIVVLDHFGFGGLANNDVLGNLFAPFRKTLKCIVLNACYSAEQANFLSKLGFYVVGMNDQISDDAATLFSKAFYQSLGEGNDYEFAYRMAMTNMSQIPDESKIPELWYGGKKIDKTAYNL